MLELKVHEGVKLKYLATYCKTVSTTCQGEEFRATRTVLDGNQRMPVFIEVFAISVFFYFDSVKKK